MGAAAVVSTSSRSRSGFVAGATGATSAGASASVDCSTGFVAHSTGGNQSVAGMCRPWMPAARIKSQRAATASALGVTYACAGTWPQPDSPCS